MPAISYTIAGEYFSTQRDLAVRVSTLLQGYRAPTRLSGQDAALIVDLLQRHPSAEIKVGCGVKAIWIKRNGSFGQGFYVERTDGVFIDFSYKQCLRPFTQASKAKFAYRRALDPQVLQHKTIFFENTINPTCEIIGEPLVWENAHVDHIPPLTFAALLADYCTEFGVDLDTVALVEPPRGIGKQLLPDEARRWADWHEARAQLRVISAVANITLVR